MEESSGPSPAIPPSPGCLCMPFRGERWQLEREKLCLELVIQFLIVFQSLRDIQSQLELELRGEFQAGERALGSRARSRTKSEGRNDLSADWFQVASERCLRALPPPWRPFPFLGCLHRAAWVPRHLGTSPSLSDLSRPAGTGRLGRTVSTAWPPLCFVFAGTEDLRA